MKEIIIIINLKQTSSSGEGSHAQTCGCCINAGTQGEVGEFRYCWLFSYLSLDYYQFMR